jgi:hypothetical protein
MAWDVIRRRGPYYGVFLVALAALMYEILLTRIFSVTMWYPYAFAAISIAMLGMTAGANLVYLFPAYFRLEKSKYHLSLYSFGLSAAMALCFLSYLCIPIIEPKEISLVDYFSMVLVYFVTSIPFVFAGICSCLALTRFPSQVSKLYSADLAGAAAGCLGLFVTLEVLDGPTAVIFAAFLAAIASLAFLSEGRSLLLRQFATALAILLIVLVVVNEVRSFQGKPFLKLRWVKGKLESAPLYEKWNAFSRVQVLGDETVEGKPKGWGISPTYIPTTNVRQLELWIDAGAQSTMTSWGGDYNRLDFLKYDVVNFPYLIRPPKQVLVVGTGGGKDILSALAFGVESVTGIEINSNILEVVNSRYADFTGHLDQDKRVRFVHDEARSYISRQADCYDLIQLSMVSTWASTSAGAFMLAENSLYTLEAWKSLLERTNPEGVLTFSRFHVKDAEWELYRLSALAVAALKELGVEKPRQHLAMVSCFISGNPAGIGCLMVSKSPFKETEIDRLERLAASMRFIVDFSPRAAVSSTFENIAEGRPFEEFTENIPANLAPPTDDSPFFFNFLRFSSMFDSAYWSQGPSAFNMKAIFTLGTLLITVLILTVGFIVLPLVLRADRVSFKTCIPLFLFFGSIGFGFMLVEISQVQRLAVFLGHPTYGLTVVLFSLLIASSLGSLFTQRISNPGFIGVILLVVLLVVLSAFGYYTPGLISTYRGYSNSARCLLAVPVLGGIGLLMGTAFPLGMKVALSRASSLTPWLWGVNGSISVFASVLAMVIHLVWGISVSFWCGVGCYVIALGAFIWACLREGYSIVPMPEKSEPATIEVEAEPVE